MATSNITLSKFSRYLQVIIEKKKAVGVEVIKDGRKHVIRSNKEVVLSAGTVGSPHILMLSGVGPKKHLQDHKVGRKALYNQSILQLR